MHDSDHITHKRMESKPNTVVAVANQAGGREDAKPPGALPGSSVPPQSSIAPVGKQKSNFEAICHGDARRRAPCKALSERRRRGVPRLLLQWRGARTTTLSMQVLPAALPNSLKPNPSLKASPNSVAHWPSSAGPAAHFALAVQRATLSVPP